MSKTIVSKTIQYKALGGPEVIEVVERQVRAPGVNEVRIRVRAAAVNPTDLLLRDPKFQSRSPWAVDASARAIPGMDAAGTIESVGPGVTRFRVGDEVMAAVLPRRPDGGAQTHYLVVPAASVVHIPEGLSLEQASMLPMNGLTAFLALDHAALEPGQTLAVSGGAGLLAHYAIAAAKQRGIFVIADAKPSEVELVKSYGADLVVERGLSFGEAVRRARPEGVDALLDTAVIGESTFVALRDGGVYLPVRTYGGKAAERGIVIKMVLVYDVLERTDWLEEVRALGKTLTLRVAGTYTPEQIADAQRVLEAGGLRGRPVIVF